MGEDIVSGQSSVILYEGSPLERIAATTVLPTERQALQEFLHSRFFVASDLVAGQYGVTGFLIVDTRPERRWESYTDNDLYGVTHGLDHCVHIPDEVRNDPVRISHYINTEHGFKMIRYFLLPKSVDAFFKNDRFLGEGMIKKACEQDAMPHWYDEEEGYDVFTHDAGSEAGRKIVERVIQEITPRLQQIGETNLQEFDFRHQRYLSFHPWQFLREALAVGEDSIVQSIGNFDRFLAAFDKRSVLRKRDIRADGVQEYRIALPANTYSPPST